MNLYYPGNIWLLLIIIPLIVSLFFWNRREKKRFSRFANPSFYPEYLSNRSQFLHSMIIREESNMAICTSMGE